MRSALWTVAGALALWFVLDGRYDLPGETLVFLLGSVVVLLLVIDALSAAFRGLLRAPKDEPER